METKKALRAERGSLRAQVDRVRAVIQDGNVTYSVNNSDDLAVRAGMDEVSYSPMMVEKAAILEALEEA